MTHPETGSSSRAPGTIPREYMPRALAFGVLAAYMFFSPFAVQVLGITSPLSRPWVMFHAHQRDLCAVEFFRQDPGGTRVKVNRLAALGYPSILDAPLEVREIRGLTKALAQAKAICSQLPEPADLRMKLRCGTKSGWQGLSVGDRNLCRYRD